MLSVPANQPRAGTGSGLELDVGLGRCRKIPYESYGMDLSRSRVDERVRYLVGLVVAVDHHGIALIGHQVAGVPGRGHRCPPLYGSAAGKIRSHRVGVSNKDEIASGDGGVIGCHCFALQRIGDETSRA